MNEEQRRAALLDAVKGIVRALGADLEPDEPEGQQYILGLAFILAHLASVAHLRGTDPDGHPLTAHDNLNLLYRRALDYLPEDDAIASE